jgi:signal transduction histidine kinase
MPTDLPHVTPFLDAQRDALEMVVKGAPLAEVLAFLTGVVERVSHHAAVASILLLDREGRLRPGAAPSLPDDYIRAIDGLKAEPTLGTCSAAAATGRVVVTRDFATDPSWVTLRHLPLALGLIGAWSQPIIDRHGRVLGTFGTYFREIREPSPAERQVVEILSHTAALAIERAQYDEAQRDAERAKDEFIAMLSHEMRNPLAPLRAALQMLPSSVDDVGTLLRLHGRMSRSVEQLIRLVEDLLETSRISRGELQLQHEPVDLKDVVEAAVETCAPLAQSSRVSIRIDVAEAPVLVSGDPLRLEQIVSNLLNNAAKYTPAGGQATVSLGRSATHAHVSVRDTGIGIAADDIDRIFEIFVRVPRADSESQRGLGLGLPLARRLALLHRGTLEAHSGGVGRGSEFTLQLPLLPSS